MNPGELRHRITIKKPPIENDDFGQPIGGWITVRSVWAAINPAIGRNYYAAEQTQTDAKYKFNTRYFADIKRQMRIYHGGLIYNIIDVMDVKMKHEELVIYCDEVVL